MQTTNIWQSVLAELELEPTISKANFVTWFKNTGVISYQENRVILAVPNAFTQAWLEKKYHQMIVVSLERVTGKPIKKLEYKICNLKNLLKEQENHQAEAETKADLPSFTPPKPVQTATIGKFGLNSKYVFDRFVVGSGSELAFAAAQAVAKKPGEAYNPLFIYGGVGLGKTHLLQAVGNQILKNFPNFNVMYASAEKFSNDFISSVKEGNAKNFQARYRNIDLLLIDDIQFISGKERTQESFFHTFNELHQQNKQVVLTSDRPPKAIPALEDRLKSRFEWGMIVDVVPPDLETRIALLQKKCTEMNCDLSDEILQVIAANVHTNVRELEGALNKIFAFHQLKNTAPTPESVKTLLSSLTVRSSQKSVTAQQIIDAVCQFYDIDTDSILGPSRAKKFSMPRQIIMHLLRRELNMSYPAIGSELGGRDHTTAMHADNKIANAIEDDLKLKQDLEMVKQRLYVGGA